MKNTVQNSIFWNWIRKKWIFVRLQSYFFIFQPYMSEKSSVEDSAECFPAKIRGIFRLVPCPVKSNQKGQWEILKILIKIWRLTALHSCDNLLPI